MITSDNTMNSQISKDMPASSKAPYKARIKSSFFAIFFFIILIILTL